MLPPDEPGTAAKAVAPLLHEKLYLLQPILLNYEK